MFLAQGTVSHPTDDGHEPVMFPLLLLEDPLGTLPEEVMLLLDEHTLTLHSPDFGLEDIDLLRQSSDMTFVVRPWAKVLNFKAVPSMSDDEFDEIQFSLVPGGKFVFECETEGLAIAIEDAVNVRKELLNTRAKYWRKSFAKRGYKAVIKQIDEEEYKAHRYEAKVLEQPMTTALTPQVHFVIHEEGLDFYDIKSGISTVALFACEWSQVEQLAQDTPKRLPSETHEQVTLRITLQR
jgi:hypothetical protein